jgi:hypothetical protein
MKENEFVLDCIVCKDKIDWNGSPTGKNNPYGATVFTSRGNYGSTVFDPIMGGDFLEINICDKCLKYAAQNQRVLHGNCLRKFEREKLWNPDLTGDNGVI